MMSRDQERSNSWPQCA